MSLNLLKNISSASVFFIAAGCLMLSIDINIDTYNRLNNLGNYFNNFEILDLFSSEFIPQLLFFVLGIIFKLDPSIIRLVFVFLGAIIFLNLFKKNALFLMILIITPPGFLLLFNTTSFFISSCFVIKFGILLYNRDSKIYELIFLGLFALLFHWASIILIVSEILFFIFLLKRSFIRNSIYILFFLLTGTAAFYLINEIIFSKLDAYSNPNISFNKYHFLMLIIYPSSLIFLTLIGSLHHINIFRNLFLLITIFILSLFGYMKIGSRLIFFIDLSLLMFIYEYVAVKYFGSKKEYLI